LLYKKSQKLLDRFLFILEFLQKMWLILLSRFIN
jgi:hypothetical protein